MKTLHTVPAHRGLTSIGGDHLLPATRHDVVSLVEIVLVVAVLIVVEAAALWYLLSVLLWTHWPVL